MLDVSLTKPGVIGAERILLRVREILGDTAIEDLPVPFTAVATDLNAGRAVWFQRGVLADALRASIAIPGVISPHEHGGRLLADGGILDPLPVAPTSTVPSDVTIGVIIGSDGGPEAGATREQKARGLLRRNVAPILDNEFIRAVRDRLGHEMPSGEAEASDAAVAATGGGAVAVDAAAESGSVPSAERVAPAFGVDEPARMGRVEVLSRSLDIMQEALTRYQVAGYPPDVLIRVPRRTVRTLDFHKASEMIELGRTLTARALDDLPELP